MLNSLIHYELELAHMHQEQLRHRATLWHLAKQQRLLPSTAGRADQVLCACSWACAAIASGVRVPVKVDSQLLRSGRWSGRTGLQSSRLISLVSGAPRKLTR